MMGVAATLIARGLDQPPPGERMEALVRGMAAMPCKNKYPVGVIGREARMAFDEARAIVRVLERGAITNEQEG